MSGFAIRFIICNVFIIVMIGLIFAIKRLLKNHLTNRMQYDLWFVMLALLAVPFLPIRPIDVTQIFPWFQGLTTLSTQTADSVVQAASILSTTKTASWINDFAISVSRDTPSFIDTLLFITWLAGILAMIWLVTKSVMCLHRLKCSAMPLQSQEVRTLYHQCLKEIGLKKEIPIYSTAFLKSPIMVGLLHPGIYLPIHLISDYNAADMRYMLLHELHHYKRKDFIANYLMNLAGILYWFNPFVWYALKEMRNDREVACDTSVLQMLDKREYEDYGNTLINFAEKVSLTPFPFTTGISSNMKQMKRRIINIASYEVPSLCKKTKGMAAFVIASLLLLCLAPLFSTYAVEEEYYQWQAEKKHVSYTDFSTYFGSYEGSFVLYDLEDDTWLIYNEGNARKRVSPDSTYKIYDALWGLETDTIMPDNSTMTWNKTNYPFDAWNRDQDLNSAMKNSVNWYFQSIDSKIGAKTIQDYIRKVQYGNQDISGGLPFYWLESTLKISPIEQVELLQKLHKNDFNLSQDNIQAVKSALHLQATTTGDFYGKTGTGRIDGQDVNGWFIGYVEDSGHTYIFAVNIQADSNANGSVASDIAISILSDLDIGK